MSQESSNSAYLATGQINIGDANSVPAGQTLSGDITVDTSGVTTIKTSVALAGNPTTTTQAAGTNSTAIATTAFAITAAANAAAAANAGLQCNVASTANIAGTYVSVAAGIGDTYTTTATGALTVDGIALTTGMIFLFKDLSTAAYNGMYTVTRAGSLGLTTLFTRRLDYDQASDINNVGTIAITSGTVNAGTSYILTTTVTTVGTDPLTYTIFTPAYANIVQSGGALGTPSSGTLTNCTGLPVAGGGTGVATLTTAYGVLCAGTTATAAVQTLAALGASGTILTSNGASALPSFQAAPAASELVLLATATAASSSTLNFTSVISNSYSKYILVLNNMVGSTSQSISIKGSTDNGSTWTGGNFDAKRTIQSLNNSTAPTYASQQSSVSFIICGGVNDGRRCGFADFTAGNKEFMWSSTVSMAASTVIDSVVAQDITGAVNINAIQMLPSAGNFTSGTVYLYGVKNT